jgi:tetratricopeptide (TPR) repeat protein
MGSGGQKNGCVRSQSQLTKAEDRTMKSGFLRRVFGLAVLALGVGLGTQAASAAPFAPSAAELAVLPPFCKVKLSADRSGDAPYAASIGPDWLHIHHYCYALNFVNRYFQDFGDRMTQSDDLKQAVNNFNYVLEHATPDFWMRAEIGTQKARILAAAKDNAQAIAALQIALQANADYAPAYAVLSDVYRDTGQKAKAIASVEQGLQHAPLDRPLQRRYKNLSGKAFVVPPTAAITPDKKVPDAASKSTVAPANAADKIITPALKPTTDAAQAPDKIGVPGNPYCRFCP